MPESKRQNVRHRGSVNPIHGICLGMTSAYSGPVPSTWTRKMPNLSKLLCDFIRHEKPGFHFTSIQINKDYGAALHVDKNNAGTSVIIGFGPYTGGELWIDDGSSTGRAVDLHGRWLTFDGTQPHAVLPFVGRRYTLVFFTRSLGSGGEVGENPSSPFAKCLLSLGFALPPKAPPPDTEKPDDLLAQATRRLALFCANAAQLGGANRLRLRLREPSGRILEVAVAPTAPLRRLMEAVARLSQGDKAEASSAVSKCDKGPATDPTGTGATPRVAWQQSGLLAASLPLTSESTTPATPAGTACTDRPAQPTSEHVAASAPQCRTLAPSTATAAETLPPATSVDASVPSPAVEPSTPQASSSDAECDKGTATATDPTGTEAALGVTAQQSSWLAASLPLTSESTAPATAAATASTDTAARPTSEVAAASVPLCRTLAPPTATAAEATSPETSVNSSVPTPTVEPSTPEASLASEERGDALSSASPPAVAPAAAAGEKMSGPEDSSPMPTWPPPSEAVSVAPLPLSTADAPAPMSTEESPATQETRALSQVAAMDNSCPSASSSSSFSPAPSPSATSSLSPPSSSTSSCAPCSSALPSSPTLQTAVSSQAVAPLPQATPTAGVMAAAGRVRLRLGSFDLLHSDTAAKLELQDGQLLDVVYEPVDDGSRNNVTTCLGSSFFDCYYPSGLAAGGKGIPCSHPRRGADAEAPNDGASRAVPQAPAFAGASAPRSPPPTPCKRRPFPPPTPFKRRRSTARPQLGCDHDSIKPVTQ
eukprot:TRINITY_DN18038_c0_g3_i1.p1 TRINITY_DN18038_c0_g3~~TRINITY_DN18038_c0_g3_i1.p1  ORF type:complete len:869 (+),score=174.94 TRINITY_DN18038_c0_g3_i1:308-2608(+)